MSVRFKKGLIHGHIMPLYGCVRKIWVEPHLSFSGFVTGLFGWSLGAMITGWLIVTLYNKQMKTAK